MQDGEGGAKTAAVAVVVVVMIESFLLSGLQARTSVRSSRSQALLGAIFFANDKVNVKVRTLIHVCVVYRVPFVCLFGC
jgi:hypothetical protein